MRTICSFGHQDEDYEDEKEEVMRESIANSVNIIKVLDNTEKP